MSLRFKGRTFAAAVAVIGSLALVAPSTASAHGSSGHPSRNALAVSQVNLVSDVPGKAPLLDPDLVNPWGLALGAATPLDVLDIQAALVLAESVRLEALHAQADARATLRWVMGRDPLDVPGSASNEAQTKAGSE